MVMILQNAIKVKDKILNSIHRHDRQEFDGIMIDGGLDYIRRSYDQANRIDVEELIISSEDSLTFIKNKLLWSDRGELGNLPIKWVKLIDCSDRMLTSILETINNLSPLHRKVIELILDERRG
jgi:hypothetical protein